ncbi:MAG: pantetheine-phosphate adenylyltransferase [Flavobacteriales bacterium]|jgi:pantetheine-phosphate adenylyltransferase|tara:strand:- start:543 stop:1001 length:459 start_codon:yes stop_codon:yes gene_type:complete
MSRIAIFPGSFDPITKGHEDIVRRAIPLFDEIIVALGVNSSKNYMYSLEQRLQWIKATFSDCKSVKVIQYEGLTIEACKKHQVKFILRGLRNSNDYEYEKSIAMMNQAMAKDIETIYLNTQPEYAAISSTIVRDIIKNQGNALPFLASGVRL